MKPISKKATAIFELCVVGLSVPGDCIRIGDGKNGFMPLSVECIGTWQANLIFSLAHYGEQNGDLMCDPEMTFMRGPKGDVFPLTYRNDFVGIDQTAAKPDGESSWKFNKKQQLDLVYFAQEWLRNIAEQQGLGA